ncbi:hypothetical protein [Tatumella saanichensis]|nr:hypothetical protein [Tatumella saanichensis]
MKPIALQRFEQLKEASRAAFCRTYTPTAAVKLRQALNKALKRRSSHE